jgi:site-specific DNA-adenine methylase
MTAYQGGKKRIGKKIHDAILAVEENLSPFEKLPYFEPFVGMGGVLRHFGKDNDRDLSASDVNTDLIMMWNALKKGWKPPLKCSREQYDKLKQSKKHSAARAFVGVVASFGTNFFHAYRLHLEPKTKII